MLSVLTSLNDTSPVVFRVIDLIGVLLNGILGGRLARGKHFDAVGFVVLAVSSALGGGIIRDVLLQQGPPVALTDPWYLGTALAGAAISMLWTFDSRPWRIALILADGTALGCWAATGALKALSAGLGVLPALMLGIITAVGGGMVRDIAAGNVPTIFGGNYLYAVPALVSAGIMVVLARLGFPTVGMLAATIVGSSFTALAHRKHWTLPQTSDWTLTLTSSQIKRLMSGRGGQWSLRRRDEGSRRRPSTDTRGSQQHDSGDGC